MNIRRIFKPHISRPTPYIVLCLTFAVSLVVSYAAGAAENAGGDINWMQMTMELFGGLALFLFGMEQMSEALKQVAGNKMREILGKLTKNRFMGAITGAFITSVIQSSSVTTVLVVGFISAGLMTLSQSIGIIMGANIGTTITAQIVAFKVTKAALLMISVGFGMLFIAKQEKIKQYGAMLMGLGMIFLGMSVMSDAMKPLRTFQPFMDLMISMENPLIGILVAAAFTGLVQSSSATTGIVIAMASQGLITLPAGIALAFGANIGTCVTALLASIGKPLDARRAAVVHTIFNVAGVLLWLLFIPWLAQAVTTLSPGYPELAGVSRLAAETPRQIANAHTIFNVANTLIFIWFTPQLARLVEFLLPQRKAEAGEELVKNRYLNEALIQTPILGLDSARLEMLHIGEYVKKMLDLSIDGILKSDQTKLQQALELDDSVDALYATTLEYLRRISMEALPEETTRELQNILNALSKQESIGDLIEGRIVSLGQSRIKNNIQISVKTSKRIHKYYSMIGAALEQAFRAVSQNNELAAKYVLEFEAEIQEAMEQNARKQIIRFSANEPNRIEAFALEDDIFEALNRVFYFAKGMVLTVQSAEIFDQIEFADNDS